MKCLEQLPTLSRSFFAILTLIFSFSLCYGAEIELKSKVTVNSNYVNLGDIAHIKGSNFEKKLLSEIKIGNIGICSRRTLSKEEIAKRIANFLRKNGVSFREIRIKGADYTTIKSLCVEIDKEHIRKLVEDFIKKNYSEYEVISVPGLSVKLPTNNYKEKLILDSLSDRYARFIYEIYANGNQFKKFWIPVRIEKKVKVVVAVKPIPRGSKIDPQDVAVREVRKSRARGGTDNLKAIVGATTRRDILPGEVIKERDITPNFAVRKNFPVKVVYKKGSLRIELLGIANQDGLIGDIIKVRNPSTGKVILCRVIGNGLVEFVSD